jgi:hypothetical protein
MQLVFDGPVDACGLRDGASRERAGGDIGSPKQERAAAGLHRWGWRRSDVGANKARVACAARMPGLSLSARPTQCRRPGVGDSAADESPRGHEIRPGSLRRKLRLFLFTLENIFPPS